MNSGSPVSSRRRKGIPLAITLPGAWHAACPAGSGRQSRIVRLCVDRQTCTPQSDGPTGSRGDHHARPHADTSGAHRDVRRTRRPGRGVPREGQTILSGLASPEEIAAYEPIIRSAACAHNTEARPLAERDDSIAKALLQIWNLWTLDEASRQFSLATRFAQVAAELMGVDAVRMYHDQAPFKESGAARIPWHLDQSFWPLDSDKIMTMWMPLVDVPAEVGTMSFMSGGQQFGYLGDFPISDESERAFAQRIQETALTVETHGPTVAGDAMFHASWSLHMAPPNPFGNVREVMTVTFIADGMRVTEPANDAQRVDFDRWLPGLQPGTSPPAS